MMFFSPVVISHGGVTIDEDRCVFRSERHLIHFTAYQPRVSDREEFCNKIPTTDKTIIVIDFVSEELRRLPMSISIEKRVDEAFKEMAFIDDRLYPSGSMHIAFNKMEKGEYQLLVHHADIIANHERIESHRDGTFRFEVTDTQAEQVAAGFIQQNKWIFYLAFAGVLIFLLANWYRNKA